MGEWKLYLWLMFPGPILWLQARHVRRLIPHLPEPPGQRAGSVGLGPLIRILVAGDSAAAGVGASSHDEALCGQLVNGLSQHGRVDWCLIAATGLDSLGLMSLLSDTPVDQYDLVILSIGVNDVTALRSPRQWRQLQDQLTKLIETRFRPQLMIHCALPPMPAFTGLPQPLRWFFGLWAQEFNRQLAGVLSGQTRRTLHQPFLEAASGGLASDGFHPGPAGYTAWAESLSKGILAARLTEQSTVSAMVHR